MSDTQTAPNHPLSLAHAQRTIARQKDTIYALTAQVGAPMFRQKQLNKHDPKNGVFGDCYRTAVAIVLGLNAKEVPHVCEKGQKNTDDLDGLIAMRNYLRHIGLTISKSVYNGELSWISLKEWMAQFNPEAAIIVTGETTRGTNHCVVMIGGEVYCDPLDGTPNQDALSGPALADGVNNWWVETITPIRAVLGGTTNG